MWTAGQRVSPTITGPGLCFPLFLLFPTFTSFSSIERLSLDSFPLPTPFFSAPYLLPPAFPAWDRASSAVRYVWEPRFARQTGARAQSEEEEKEEEEEEEDNDDEEEEEEFEEEKIKKDQEGPEKREKVFSA